MKLAEMDRSSASRAKRTQPNQSPPSPMRKRRQSTSWRDLNQSLSVKLQEGGPGTRMSPTQESDTFHDVHHLPQHDIDYYMTGELSSANSSCHYPKDESWDPYFSNQPTLTLSNRYSPSTGCRLPDLGEVYHQPSGSTTMYPAPSASACTSCIDEAPNSATCQTSDETNCDWSSVCIDPDCSESICEECCQDCAEDCGSDCGVPLNHDRVDPRTNDYYSCDGSFSELFGDQAAELFDVDGRLPQLPMDNMQIESIDFGLFPDDAHADISTLSKHIMPEIPCSPDHDVKASSTPMQLHPKSKSPEPAQAAHIDNTLTPNLEPYFGYNSHQSANVDAATAPEGQRSTKTIPASPGWGSSDDGRILAASLASSDTNTTPFIQCQWTDSNGQPCRRVFALGDDMHEHLKAAHGVKSEVLCRWIGCRVGIHGVTRHQYASSVERHTWGHSGYRPYKCPTCSEGFAAAKLRDEHFTSLHLGKKTFCCDVCSHQCTSATNLKRHKDDKHRTGRFQCEFCNRNGKIRLFPRGPNLARHFRKCRSALAHFPEAISTKTGKMDDDWLPPGYQKGHHGMDRAKIIPPNYLPLSTVG